MTRVAVPSPSGIEALDAALSLIDLEEDIRVSTARPTPPPADIR
jgi:hypothetical protein